MDETVRPAAPDDAATILRFIHGLAAYQKAAAAVEVDAATLRRQLSAERPPFECLLVEQDGLARGMALFFQSYSTWRGRPGLYLEDLFVEPGARGKGLGIALFRGLAEIAAQRECARIEWSVMDWNSQTIGFYEALGALPQEGSTVYRLDRDALTALRDTAPA